MNINSDRAAAWGKRAIDTQFILNPQGTSLGICLAFMMNGALGWASPTLEQFKAVRFAAIRLWHLCFAGIFIFNIRPYWRRNKIDPRVEALISFAEREVAKRHMSPWQRNELYANLYAKVLAKVVLDDDTRKSISAMNSSGCGKWQATPK